MKILNKNIFNEIDQKFFIVVDDFLPNNQAIEIKNSVFNYKTQWTLNEATCLYEDYLIQKKINNNCREYFQFGHNYVTYDHNKQQSTIVDNNRVVFYVTEQFNKKYDLTSLEIFRIKANLLTQYQNNKKQYFNTPHLDYYFKHYVLLYYVNDSDGDTIFFKNNKILNKVSPKMNRIVMFRGDLLHASNHPIKSQGRAILNFNIKNVEN